MIRGFFAVVGGFLVMALVVSVGTFLAVKILLSGSMLAAQRPTPPYLAANLAISLVGAVLGGLIARRIGGPSGSTCVYILAGLVATMTLVQILVSRGAPENGQPGWYMPVIGLIGFLGVLAGGWRLR